MPERRPVLLKRFPAATPLLCALAALAALGGCRRAEPPPPPEIRPVRVMTVMKLAAGETVSLTGTVQAQTEVNYAFRIDGRMIDRPVRVGDAIRPGQLLARLDASNEEASLASARAQLAAARAQATEQRNNYNRQKQLLAQRFISQAAFDQIAANLQSAEAGVTSAQSQVDLAQNRVSYTRLVADAPGTVAAVGAEPGEVVPAGRMVVQAARKEGRDAVFDVPAQIKDRAPSNPEITVALTTDASVTAKGRVREVSPRADPVTGTFKVRIGLIDPPAGLRLGSTVTGSMRMETAAAIELPGSALVRAGAQSAVWIVDPKTETVAQRTIRVAGHDADRVVVAEGLEQGDLVVTAGVQALHPGQKVRLLGAAK
ncbi:MAG TPA: efflux RND transporter periplasmic adaptor subunit [Burkholderiales bacterium]|nr:efflux RND transporter periplasmic adaptor subunit [Burkholderiales bacterium]